MIILTLQITHKEIWLTIFSYVSIRVKKNVIECIWEVTCMTGIKNNAEKEYDGSLISRVICIISFQKAYLKINDLPSNIGH